MTHFEQYGYEIIKNAISKETANLAAIEFEMVRDQNPQSVNDGLVENAFWWYGSFVSESLLQILLPKVEEVTKLHLFPTYSYGRIYYNGAKMKRHIDRPSCQYSVTITISIDENSESWPIGFKDLNGNDKELHLDVGDMCVYRGTELEHWRDQYKGEKQIQFFLHYVDQNGIYSDFKYDRRKMLGLPHINMR